MSTTTVKLPDGREVSSASEEWRAECLRRHNAWIEARAGHVAVLMGMRFREDRTAYMERLGVELGPDKAKEVGEAFSARYRERSAAAAQRRQGATAP